MNPKIQNILNCLDQKVYQYGTINLKVDKWDQIQCRFVKAKIQLTITLDNKIIYSQDGAILRDEIIQENYQIPEVLNIEQIKHLQWQGEYCQNKRKIGKWIATWNGEALLDIGGYSKKIGNIIYYDSGLKQGLWKELIRQYSSHAQVYQCGQYFNDKKYGTWIYNYKNKKIGGGSYNNQGQKNGKWIDLNNGFYDKSQVTYCGEYKNGKKVSIWETKYEGKQIGGGAYDNGGEGIKVGSWIEISDGFNKYSQVTYNGEYKSGKKVGRWDIKYQGRQIGGGTYDKEGDEFKIGRWIELSDGFKWNSEITYDGQYLNSIKIGRWDIFNDDLKIGGGSYDEGVKIGRWIELSDEFWSGSQVTYNGEYKNDQKIGRWEIQYESKHIGGGSYDEGGNGIKIEKWIELSDEFWSGSQVTYNGEYKNGKRVGRWDIQYKKGQADRKNEYMQKNLQECIIGGGQYDEGDNELKIGKWIELSDGFYDYSQVTYNGEYKYGKKVGSWQIQYEGRQIGGGSYDERGNGLKIERWMELSDGFNWNQQITYNGEYKNGKKVGRWSIKFEGEQIGGGSYDERGDGIKIERWTELSEDFKGNSKKIIKGEYQNGRKVGLWMEIDIKNNEICSKVKYDN